MGGAGAREGQPSTGTPRTLRPEGQGRPLAAPGSRVSEKPGPGTLGRVSRRADTQSESGLDSRAVGARLTPARSPEPRGACHGAGGAEGMWASGDRKWPTRLPLRWKLETHRPKTLGKTQAQEDSSPGREQTLMAETQD